MDWILDSHVVVVLTQQREWVELLERWIQWGWVVLVEKAAFS
jgi:hypothetical protein